MKINSIKMVLTSICVLAGGIFALTYLAAGESESAADGSPAVKDGNSFIKPSRHDFSKKTLWFGKVKSGSDVVITSLIAGRVTSVKCKDGESVKKDQVLFTLGGQQIANQKKILKQNIANLTERIRLAKEILKSKREALDLKLTTKELVTTAEDTVKMLEMQKKSAENTLKQTEEFSEIRAATSGIYKGIVLSPGQMVVAGQALARIVSTDYIFIEATLYPGEAVKSLTGKNVTINNGETVINGKVISIMPQKNSTGATVVRISAKFANGKYSIGKLLRGEVVLVEHKNALCVPERCVIRNEENQYFIFIKNGENCERRKVKTGLTSGTMVEIRSGLKKDDLVLDKGAYELYYKNFNKTYKVAD